MREGGHDERGVPMRRAGHEIAEVVGDDERHLPVRQHRRLGPSRRPGGKEEPARVVVLDAGDGCRLAVMGRDQPVVILPELGRADRHHEPDRGGGFRHRPGVIGETGATDHRRRTTRASEIGDLLRRLPKVRRDPDSTQPEAREHRFEQLVAVPRLHEDAIAFGDTSGGKGRCHRVDPSIEERPGPGLLAPDEADLVAMPAGGLAEKMSEVHHSLRAGCDATLGDQRAHRHHAPSSILTPSASAARRKPTRVSALRGMPSAA